MKRYLKIYLYLARYCLLGDLEFRLNFFLWTISNTVWSLLTVVTVQFVYNQVDSIAGWDKNDAYVLAIVNSLIISLLWAFVLPSLTRFHNLTRKGELDFLLLKPLNTRFLISSKTIEFDMYPRMIVLFALLVIFLQSHFSIPFINWVLFGFSLLVGTVIFYNFAYILATTNFWLVNVFNLENLFDSIYDLGRLPVGIFKGGVKLVFIYVVPMAFLGTYSTQILLGKSGWETLVSYLITLIVGALFSQWFWNFALKRYSSASS